MCPDTLNLLQKAMHAAQTTIAILLSLPDLLLYCLEFICLVTAGWTNSINIFELDGEFNIWSILTHEPSSDSNTNTRTTRLLTSMYRFFQTCGGTSRNRLTPSRCLWSSTWSCVASRPSAARSPPPRGSRTTCPSTSRSTRVTSECWRRWSV